MSTAPKRRFEIEVHVSGDTWDDVKRGVEFLLPHIIDHGPNCNSVGGGCSSGYWVNVVEDPEMTPQLYVSALEAYLAARNAAVDTTKPVADKGKT